MSVKMAYYGKWWNYNDIMVTSMTHLVIVNSYVKLPEWTYTYSKYVVVPKANIHIHLLYER